VSKIFFGFSCGVLIIIFRVWSIHIDGVLYAILVMNLFTPLLDKIKKKKTPVQVVNLERG
jgi:electron transport complex protein RnfD